MQEIEVNVRSFEKTRNAEERSVRCSQKLEMQKQKKNQCQMFSKTSNAERKK